ncbi:MAG: hypothetical protein ACLQIB_12215 [Isosphaeraceae bacterium]
MHAQSTRKFTLLDAMILVAATAAGLALLRMLLAEGRFSLGAIFVGRFTSRVLGGIEWAYPFLMMWTFALVILGLRPPRPPIRRLARQPGMAACSAASLILVVQLLGIIPFEVIWSLRSMMAQASMPPVNLPRVKIPIGPSSPPAKTTSPYGAPTPASSPGSGSVAQPAPQPSQPRGILPSLPTSPTLPSGYWPGWYIIRAIHVHMIQQGYAAAAVGGAWLVLLLAGSWKPKPSWIDRSGRVLGILWVVPYLVYRADLSRLWY